ncbi:MAG: hypothetical protein KatS3mg111_2774 [Pirellulaceae bacterium]|nr:MAG: hypothetical protein KatS3mg111_2774 [Pirellulaceae bacterium]
MLRRARRNGWHALLVLLPLVGVLGTFPSAAGVPPCAFLGSMAGRAGVGQAGGMAPLAVVVAPQGTAERERGEPVDSAPASTAPWQLEVGLAGVVKVGQPCPVRVVGPAAVLNQASWLEIRTVDGDGVAVTYRCVIDKPLATRRGAAAEGSLRAVVRIGRRGAEITARILDADHRELGRVEARHEDLMWLEAGQPLVLALADSCGLETLVRTDQRHGTATFSIATVEQAEQLPEHWRAYLPCDLVIIPVRQNGWLETLTLAQWQALDDYLRRGGNAMVVMAGVPQGWESDPRWQVLRSLIPGKIVAEGTVRDPGLLETLVATDHPIAPFATHVLDEVRGNIELQLVDHLARPVPWWVRAPHGNGTVQFVASDLGSGALAQWQDRPLIWERLVAPFLDTSISEAAQGAEKASSNYLGYNDLVGQLRATLDYFQGVRVLSFGQLTAILAVVLLVVGPVDYYVSVRWLRRPDTSWYLSGGVLLATSIGMVVLYRQMRPDELRINWAQVIDVDTTSGRVDGRLWAHVYSGRARKLEVRPVGKVGGGVRLDWQGLPGTGLGGLDTSLSTEHGMPPYAISIQRGGAWIDGVGVAAAGTKAIYGDWIANIELAGQSDLTELSGVDQVTGTVVNPLPMDLHDAVLFYHNWFYRLNSRIPAGGSISIGLDNIPKDISRKLTDRRNIEQSELASRWDPADRQAMDRLLELMMFHKAASGRNYTSLQHRYEMHMDLSNLLETNRAILVARVDVPMVELEVQAEDREDLKPIAELQRVWCRLILPVQPSSGSAVAARR